jgi:hypothetical protein
MQDEARLAKLLVDLVCQEQTEKGRIQLDNWRAASARNEVFVQTVTSDASILDDLRIYMGMDKAVLLKKIEAGISRIEPFSRPDLSAVPSFRPSRGRLKAYLLWSAAAIFLACLILTYLLRAPGKENQTALTPAGGNADPFYSAKAPDSGAVRLALGDGTVRDLESIKEGMVAQQGNIRTSIAEDGRLLRYTAVASGTNSAEVYNTLTVPNGSRFKLQLSDGTRVKLNVGSSIKYPVAFTGEKRIVEVTGEVFFDVAPDSRHPFVVRAHKEEIEVLGTAFVVSDYPREKSAKIAVSSGLVRVRSGKKTIDLQTSQGADIVESGDIAMDPNMDIQSMVSLKDEYFNFDKLDLKTALEQLAQSYHMRIMFKDNINNGPFGSGDIQRDLPIKRLLKDLELPNLHFTVNMQDNTIVVTR